MASGCGPPPGPRHQAAVAEAAEPGPHGVEEALRHQPPNLTNADGPRRLAVLLPEKDQPRPQKDRGDCCGEAAPLGQ
eukprot:12392984-Prorocentrum_lima.AAC.1